MSWIGILMQFVNTNTLCLGTCHPCFVELNGSVSWCSHFMTSWRETKQPPPPEENGSMPAYVVVVRRECDLVFISETISIASIDFSLARSSVPWVHVSERKTVARRRLRSEAIFRIRKINYLIYNYHKSMNSSSCDCLNLKGCWRYHCRCVQANSLLTSQEGRQQTHGHVSEKKSLSLDLASAPWIKHSYTRRNGGRHAALLGNPKLHRMLRDKIP